MYNTWRLVDFSSMMWMPWHVTTNKATLLYVYKMAHQAWHATGEYQRFEILIAENLSPEFILLYLNMIHCGKTLGHVASNGNFDSVQKIRV